MSNESDFSVTLDGETIRVPLAKARKLCPLEVKAMEEAGKQVSEAAKRGDAKAMAAATEVLKERMLSLMHALGEEARRQRGQAVEPQ